MSSPRAVDWQRPWPMSPLTLVGRALAEGAAVADAEITALGSGISFLSTSAERPSWTTTSGRDGRFRLEIPASPELAAELALLIRARDVAPRLFAVGEEGIASLPHRPHLDLGDLELEVGISIEGRVVVFVNGDRGVVPLAGAVVAHWTDDVGAPATVVTGEDGRFRLDHRPSHGAIGVAASGRSTRLLHPFAGRRSGDLDLGDVRLDTGIELAGTALDEAGSALAGAEVRATRPDLPPSLARALGVAARTDGSGAFVLAGLDPSDSASVSLAVERKGFRGGWGDRAVERREHPSGSRLELLRPIQLSANGTIEFEVTDPEGAPIPGAEILAMPLDLVGAATYGGRTDRNGRGLLDELEPGVLHRCIASAPGFASSEPIDVVASLQPDTVRAVLEPLPNVSRFAVGVGSGEERRERDARWRLATVDLVPLPRARRAPTWRQRVAQDGWARFEAVPAGSYQVEVAGRDCASTTGPVELSPGSAFELDVACVPVGQEAALGELTVVGIVVAEDGAPIAGARVSSDPRHSSVTAADGSFRLVSGVGPSISLAVEPPTGSALALWCRQVDSPRWPLGGELDIGEIALAPGAEVDVSIAPLSLSDHAVVRAGRIDGPCEVEAVRVGESYRLPGLGAGRWRIAAFARGVETSRILDLAPADRQRISLSLPHAVAVSGTIRIDSEAAGFALVHVLVERDGIEFDGASNLDDLGRFRIDGVPAGRALLYAQLDGPTVRRELVLETDTEVEIVLTTGRLRGVALDADGEPVAGVAIEAAADLTTDHYPRRVVRSGRDGRFSLDGLLEGRWTLHAEDWTRRAGSVEVVVGAGSTESVEVLVKPDLSNP